MQQIERSQASGDGGLAPLHFSHNPGLSSRVIAVHQSLASMPVQVRGLHHVTAIAKDPRRNYDFYTRVLGMRLVKKTVNFDDPHTYHFYYGDQQGTPGTILTFFPWPSIQSGRRGLHQTTEIGLSVPKGSLDSWLERLDGEGIIYAKPATRFGQRFMSFLDPDGLKFELVETEDPRPPYGGSDLDEQMALRGFHHVTITQNKVQPTADVLTELLGYTFQESEVNRFRFKNGNAETASIIDIVEAPGEAPALTAGGSVHHIAFRVANRAEEMQLREAIVARGLQVTPQIDRNYFFSLYFREPGGVLFEIATDEPGFMVDEDLASLGTALKLPQQYEPRRKEIESVLPSLV